MTQVKSNPQQLVIGVLGAKRSGKDTFAKAILNMDTDFVRLGFADALYREVAEAFEVDVEFLGNEAVKDVPVDRLGLVYCNNKEFTEVVLNQLEANPDFKNKGLDEFTLSPRFLLQRWGTEYRRMLYRDDYWRAIVDDAITSNPTKHFIITDVRFKNEVDLLTMKHQATTVRVLREKVDMLMAKLRAEGDPAALHPSETELLSYITEFTFDNVEGDFNCLANDAQMLLAHLKMKLATETAKLETPLVSITR